VAILLCQHKNYNSLILLSLTVSDLSVFTFFDGFATYVSKNGLLISCIYASDHYSLIYFASYIIKGLHNHVLMTFEPVVGLSLNLV
jgi:hypothetical protein